MSTTEPNCEKGMEEDAARGIVADVEVRTVGDVEVRTVGDVETESVSEALSRREVVGSCSKVSLTMPESLSELLPQLAASRPMAASRLVIRMRFGSAQ